MQLHISLALFVGLSDASLQVFEEKKLLKILRKPDGYVLFTDLSKGKHILTVKHPGYKDAKIDVEIEENKTVIETLRLLPLKNDFNCKLKLTNLKPFIKVYLADHNELFQLTKDYGKNSQSIFLYSKTKARLPLKLLCLDSKAPEVCIITDMQGEEYFLTEALLYEHKIRTKFYPAMEFIADEKGEISSLFPCSGKISILCDEKLYETEIKEGENLWQIP